MGEENTLIGQKKHQNFKNSTIWIIDLNLTTKVVRITRESCEEFFGLEESRKNDLLADSDGLLSVFS